MASIILVRHGQASFGAQNYDQLSATGERQAKALGCHFNRCDIQPSLVLSGNMSRHIATRDHCLAQMDPVKSLSHTAIINPEWNEFDHENVLSVFDARLSSPQSTGAFLSSQTNPAHAFITLFTQAITQWQLQEDNTAYTESWLHFKQRINRAMQQLIEQVSEQDIAIVYTSGGVISALILDLLVMPNEQMMTLNQQVINASMTKIFVKHKQAHLVSFNEHAYLLNEREGKHNALVTRL